MTLRDIMTTNVVSAKPSDSVLTVAQKMKKANIGCVPILDNEELVGIITDRDITVRVTAAGLNPAEHEVQTFMNTRPVSASPEMTIEAAIGFMGEKGVRRLPILEKGKLIGIVSIDDISSAIDDKEMIGWAISRIVKSESFKKTA